RVVLLQEQTDLARQGIYAVTAQSHYRAMPLITEVDSWNEKIVQAKADFARDMDAIRATAEPEVMTILDRLASDDTRFSAASHDVQRLYDAGDLKSAENVHITAEPEFSHEREDGLNVLINLLSQEARQEQAAFQNGRQFLTIAVAAFSAVSLLTARAMRAVLSCSVIRPVRKIDVALARIADGDFGQVVDVPNRDEF